MRVLLAIIFMAGLTGCINEEVGNPQVDGNGSTWDTTLQIGSIFVPNDSIFENALIEKSQDSRLAGFVEKAASGAHLKIGFIGGSITQGESSTALEKRFADKMIHFLQKKYPDATFESIISGVPGTTSRFGASRVQNKILSKSPDLIVIEFTVNDSKISQEYMIQTYEGLVRQCLKKPHVAIMLLFLSFPHLDAINDSTPVPLPGPEVVEGYWLHLDSTVEKQHQKIGKHYQLPMVSYRKAIHAPLVTGQLAVESIIADPVHPNDQGHLLIGYLMAEALSILGTSSKTTTGSKSIPKPLVTDIFASVKTYDGKVDADFKIESSWKKENNPDGTISFSTNTAGDSILIYSEVKDLDFGYYKMGGGTGKIEVSMRKNPSEKSQSEKLFKVVDTLSNELPNSTTGKIEVFNRIVMSEKKEKRTFLIRYLGSGDFTIRRITYAP